MCEMKLFHLVQSFNLDEYMVGIHPRGSDSVKPNFHITIDTHMRRRKAAKKAAKKGGKKRR